jgi:hypothetical protein
MVKVRVTTDEGSVMELEGQARFGSKSHETRSTMGFSYD